MFWLFEIVKGRKSKIINLDVRIKSISMGWALGMDKSLEDCLKEDGKINHFSRFYGMAN